MRPENWMKWDIYSEQDPKTQWYLSKFADPMRGLGFFVHVVSKLYQANDHYLDNDLVFREGTAAALKWTSEEVEQAIAWLCLAGLFVSKDGRFTSVRVQRETAARGQVSERRAEAGRKGGMNSKGSKQLLSTCLPLLNTEKQTQADKSRVDKIRVEEINTKSAPHFGEGKPRKEQNYLELKTEDFELGPRWGVQAIAALKKWIEYKTAAGKPKLLRSYQAEIGIYRDRPQDFAALVDRAVAANWQGLNAHLPMTAAPASNFARIDPVAARAAREQALAEKLKLEDEQNEAI